MSRISTSASSASAPIRAAWSCPSLSSYSRSRYTKLEFALQPARIQGRLMKDRSILGLDRDKACNLAPLPFDVPVQRFVRGVALARADCGMKAAARRLRPHAAGGAGGWGPCFGL